MSYILDAVLLSSQQANPNDPPRLELFLASVPPVKEEIPSRPRRLATGVACAVALAGLAWIHAGIAPGSRSDSDAVPVAGVSLVPTEKMPSSGGVVPAKAAATEPEAMAARVSLAAPQQTVLADPPAAARERPSDDGRGLGNGLRPLPPIAQAEALAEKPTLVVLQKSVGAAAKPKVVIVDPPKPVGADKAKPAVPEKPKAVAAEKSKTAPAVLSKNQPEPGRVYRVPDLPADLQNLARQVSVSGFAVADKGQDRMAIINDRALREGDLVDANFKVESISADSVVFNLKGYRFRKGRS